MLSSGYPLGYPCGISKVNYKVIFICSSPNIILLVKI